MSSRPIQRARVFGAAMIALVTACHAPVSIGPAPPLPPAPLGRARAAGIPIRGCTAELASYEQASHRMGEHAVEKPRAPKPKRPRAPSRAPIDRPLGFTNRLGDDYELAAMLVAVDSEIVFVSSSPGELVPATLTKLGPEPHRVLVRALVRRKLVGGLFDYVWDCRSIAASGEIASIPAQKASSGAEPSPLGVVLEGTPEWASARIDGVVPEDIEGVSFRE